MKHVEQAVANVADFVWGPPLLFLLLGTHVFLTLRLKIIQRYVITAIRLSFSRKIEGRGDISPFSSLMTALAATIGTGNIVGVSTAVASGGPGAVLWMWLTGVFGMATKYSEALLSVKFRITTTRGEMAGGPMYVIEHGMQKRWLGMIFAGLTAISAFGIGNMVQANSISVLVYDTCGLSSWITGLIMSMLTALVILKGIKSIGRACDIMVPFMAIAYIVGCLVILILGIDKVPATLRLIISSAFSGQAAIGGFIGAGVREAIRFGVARGLFSNESGLGSAPIVSAAAQTLNSVRQALIASTGTFWDTVVVCAMTGLVVVNSGQWQSGANGAILTKAAFNEIPIVGPIVLFTGLLTFVFSTIIGWSYYGEKAAEYIFGSGIIKVYRYLWIVFVMLGSILTLPLVWSLADVTNGLMAIPNLVSIVVLSSIVVTETKKYLWSGKINERDEEI